MQQESLANLEDELTSSAAQIESSLNSLKNNQQQEQVLKTTLSELNSKIDEFSVREAISSMQPGDMSTETLADTEADQIRKVLAAAGGNKSRAACCR